MKIFSAKQIRDLDRETIEREGISSLELMKRASTAFFNWLIRKYPDKSTSFLVFAGVGNNGGDGLVVARLLYKQGYNVKVCVVEFSEKYSEDCAHNIRRIKAENLQYRIIREKSDIPDISSFDVIIDAIFGTGLSRDIVGIARDVIEAINLSGKDVVSVDVPSGLFLDKKTKFAVKACNTVTFQIPKLALYFPDNKDFCGEVSVVNIDLNEEVIDEMVSDVFFVQKEDVANEIKPLEKYAHKGTQGHALIIGGSFGKMGSVCLASKSALKSGCGLVTAYVPKCGVNVLQCSFPEVMAIADTCEYYITDIKFDIKPNAIGIGIGMGTDDTTQKAFYNMLKSCDVPLVIDADGINILSMNKQWLSDLPSGTIMTPHPKELERLVGEWNDDFEKIDKVRNFAKKCGVILVIKGAYSLIIDSESIYVNSSGTPALATAGSGDVLTGIITSLLAQGYLPLNAAIAGVFVHGMTANLTSGKINSRSFVASDIIENIGNVYNYLESCRCLSD